MTLPPDETMKTLKIIIVMLLLSSTAWAITNVVVTVVMSDDAYTNLVAIASDKGQTPQQYLQSTNQGLVAEFNKGNDAIRFRLLLQLWENATLQKKLAAIQALQ